MIFRRAIRREFRHAAAGVFVALFAIALTMVLIRLLGQAAGGRVPADAVMALIGFGALAQLPIILSLTLFIAVLLPLSRSYRDSEMVVWFAAGLPLTAFIRPVLQFALPFSLVIAGLTLFVTPWANMQSEIYRTAMEDRDDSSRVAPGIFRESAGGQRVFFVESGSAEEGRLRGVFVVSEQEGALTMMVSKLGSVIVDAQGDRFVVLDDGHRYDGAPGSAGFRVVEFDRYEVLIESREPASPTVRLKATPSVELLEQLESRRAVGELANRIGLPVAALMLSLLAIPLSFVNPRAGRGANLLMAVLAFMVYNNVISLVGTWIVQGKLSAGVAMVLPHLVVAGLLVLLFYKRLAVSPFWSARA